MKRMTTLPAAALSAAELRILAAFRAMDQQVRDEYALLMERSAKAYPHRATPALRLVAGGSE